ncbi:tetratricopeptide repeat protein [Commensalibacter oyaizuii]|uniref:CDC27 family protein n=1 Tax=Commensalibacter oyaizuii TaxID=3043873 RepID=A0ABT6Q592_9PROT|nr:CDC27 family protein [Commensalibacter sp. TBRC 16381]MDI2091721.1 CDC27 family protein [Commensalibacter sp. TBRC 16381]
MKYASFMRHLMVVSILGSGVVLSAPFTGVAKEVVSNAMAVPLKKAKQLMTQGKYAQAEAAIKEAQAIPNPSAYEHDIIVRLQIALAEKQNQTDNAIAGYDRLLASKRLTPAERLNATMAQASLAYRAKNYSQAIHYIENYFKAGGNNPNMTTLLIQSYYLNKNYQEAMQAQQKQIDQEVKKGIIPAESQWQIMINCQQKLGDQDGVRHSYIQLAIHYSKPEYWSHVMSALIATKGLSPQVELEIWQIRLQAGLLTTADQYISMAELAVQAGLPHVASEVVVKGRAKGVFTGKSADRALRFEDYLGKIIREKKAKSSELMEKARKNSLGDDLFKLGYDAYAGGQITDGLKIMQEALAKPMVDRNIALLEYAMVEANTGNKGKAISLLKTITGKNVPAELAELWLIKLQAK